jgi:Cdc6-like AAA superfamily ATPase
MIDIGDLRAKVVSYGNVKDDMEKLLFSANVALANKVEKGAMVVGESGSGKTTMLKRFKERLEKQHEEAGNPLSVTIINCPSALRGNDLYVTILGGLGDPNPEKGTLAQVKKRIDKQIKNNNIRVLVIDEFQQMLEQLKAKRVYQLTDYLKELMDKHKLYMVFAGLDKVLETTQINGQFKSRVDLAINKKLMSVQTFESFKELRTFLNGIQNLNDIPGTPFSDVTFVYRMQASTGGDLRKIAGLINSAVENANLNNATKLCSKDFTQAFNMTLGTLDNSFKLDKGKIFEVSSNPWNMNQDSLRGKFGVTYSI